MSKQSKVNLLDQEGNWVNEKKNLMLHSLDRYAF